MLFLDEAADEFLPTYDVQSVDSNLVSFVKTDTVCSLLWFHFTLEILIKKNRIDLKELFESHLKVVCKSKDKVCFNDA